ncbi:hypothetical protein B1201_07085 [Acinetobacter sp. ANC 5600]|nr:hypothetical protein B1201_07085 [Acinetobacter sp. ANC 5600]
MWSFCIGMTNIKIKDIKTHTILLKYSAIFKYFKSIIQAFLVFGMTNTQCENVIFQFEFLTIIF